MTRRSQFFALRGGLDQETDALSIPPGRAIGVLNHEAVASGVQRTEGFERFDGHKAPSDTGFYLIGFSEGAVPFAAGQTVTGQSSGATARVLAPARLESGQYSSGGPLKTVILLGNGLSASGPFNPPPNNGIRYAPPVMGPAVAMWQSISSRPDTPVVVAGTFSNLAVRLPTPLLAGTSWKWTLVVDGDPTDLSVTVDSTGLVQIDNEHSVTIEAGQKVCFKSEPIGNPSAQNNVQLSCLFTAAEGQVGPLFTVWVAGTGAGTTGYGVPGTTNSAVQAQSSRLGTMPTDGSIRQLFITTNNAPGAGQWRKVTLCKKGPSTGNVWVDMFSVTISDTATQASALGHADYVAGDMIQLRKEASAGAVLALTYCGMDWNPTTAGESIFIAAGTGSFSKTDTIYQSLQGTAENSETVESDVVELMPVDCAVTRFRADMAVAPGATHSRIQTIRRNSVDTAATVPVSGTDTSGVYNGAVQFTAGDLVSWKSVPVNTPASTNPLGTSGVIIVGTYVVGNAVGTLPVQVLDGDFQTAEYITIETQAAAARLDTLPVLGDWRSGPDELSWLTDAVSYSRAQITAVPGSGPVRGVVWYGGHLNAWRDNADASHGILNQSTSAGWTPANLGQSLAFTKGGPYQIAAGDVVTGDQSAAQATVRYVALDSGDWFSSDAAGLLILDNVVGNFGDETLTVANHVACAKCHSAQQAVTFPAGGRYEFDIFNFYATAQFERCYGANGVSKAFDFDGSTVAFISTGMEQAGQPDTPRSVREHKNHLFLVFPYGSLQHSSLGTPRDFSGLLGAAELGMGHEITNVIPNSAAAMLIFTADNISQLTGNDSSDWVLEPIAEKNAGAMEYTAQQLGSVIYLDNGGVRSINSAGFANFKLGSYTSLIAKELGRKRSAGIVPVASCVIKAKAQYLLFFSDGSGISIFFGLKQPEAMLFEYPFVVSCLWVGQVDGVERCFVGAEDGFVYELNKGTSFDGDLISAFIQLPFNHSGNPDMLKRYHRLSLNVQGAPGTEIGLIADFDGTSEQPFSLLDTLTLQGGGGIWGVASWGEFLWSSPSVASADYWVDGQGFTMSPTFISRQSLVPSYIISGVRSEFTPRGGKR